MINHCDTGTEFIWFGVYLIFYPYFHRQVRAPQLPRQEQWRLWCQGLQRRADSRVRLKRLSWFKKSGVHGHWGLWFESLKYRSSWVSKNACFFMVKVLGFTEQNRQLKSGSEDALWRHRISVQTAGLESSSNWANFVGLIWALSLILDDVKSWLGRIGV